MARAMLMGGTRVKPVEPVPGMEVTDMLTNVSKAVFAAAFVTLAPVAPLLIGSASDADAHTYVSGTVTFGSPVAVLGFSYGNPYAYGPVYESPEECGVGPVYYYPQYRVYAPRYPVFRYYSYSAPRYYYPHRSYGVRGHDYGYRGYSRGHAYGHSYRGSGGYYGGRQYDRSDGRHDGHWNGHSNGHSNGRNSIRGHSRDDR
ncbi:MAG TPA: hypothetical protein VFE84_14100 [Patescibacteria group bacterium]|nr:hypothetical protein [Patescibacteria group bacterium]